MGQQSSFALAAILGVLFMIVLAMTLPSGFDYEMTYRPVTEKFLQGETQLYDSESRGFYNAPWMIVLFVPSAFFSPTMGYIVLNSLLWLLILAALWWLKHRLLAPPALALWLAVLNLHIFSLFFLGQVDGLLLTGTVLGWLGIQQQRPWVLGLGFMILATKPLNVILVGLLFLVGIRHWKPVDIGKTLLPTVGAWVLSSLLIGLDWPLRYLDNLSADPPDTLLIMTIWEAANSLNIPHWPIALAGIVATGWFVRIAWREGVSGWTVSLAVALNLLFSNYAYSHHYVILIPAFLYIAQGQPRAMWICYAIMWTPFVRGALGQMPLDILYPLLLWVVLTNKGRRSGKTARRHENQAVSA